MVEASSSTAIKAASGRTDWSDSLGLKIGVLQRQISQVASDRLEVAKELSQDGSLLSRWGSRSLAWRIFLGILPLNDDTESTQVEWVKKTRAIRQKWASLEQSMSLKVIASTTKNFNPLAPPKVDEAAQFEKEMKALIWQDVSRTLQEFNYFTKTMTKDLMSQLLYLWGRENPDYGYKQGMNEILALIVIVFDTERVEQQQTTPVDWSTLSDEEIARSHLVEYLFDQASVKADVYACFDSILQLGIKHLYMDTKDITELKKSRMRKQEAQNKDELFSFGVSKEQEQKQFRKELEQAYEREKQKSVISKRCTRIYTEHLQKLEPNLHKHLVDNEVVPELHLTRWLRCILSREFSLENSLRIWDFILSGIDKSMLVAFSPGQENLDDLLKKPNEDPFINLECLSVAMIALIKEELLESDFSMCLGLLMSYKEPDQLTQVLEHANKVRLALIENQPYERVPSPRPFSQEQQLSQESHHYRSEEAKQMSVKEQINMPQSNEKRLMADTKSKQFNQLEAKSSFNPLAGGSKSTSSFSQAKNSSSGNQNQISTSNTFKSATQQSYQRVQSTLESVSPFITTAGQKASQAKASLAENLMPTISNIMGKSKEVIGAASATVSKAYTQGSRKYNGAESAAGQYPAGDTMHQYRQEEEFTLVNQSASSKAQARGMQQTSLTEPHHHMQTSPRKEPNSGSLKHLLNSKSQREFQPQSSSTLPSSSQQQDQMMKQNQELRKLVKTSVLKLGVLSNNLSSLKGEIGEHDKLDMSIGQIHALIDALNQGVEAQPRNNNY